MLSLKLILTLTLALTLTSIGFGGFDVRRVRFRVRVRVIVRFGLFLVTREPDNIRGCCVYVSVAEGGGRGTTSTGHDCMGHWTGL